MVFESFRLSDVGGIVFDHETITDRHKRFLYNINPYIIFAKWGYCSETKSFYDTKHISVFEIDFTINTEVDVIFMFTGDRMVFSVYLRDNRFMVIILKMRIQPITLRCGFDYMGVKSFTMEASEFYASISDSDTWEKIGLE